MGVVNVHVGVAFTYPIIQLSDEVFWLESPQLFG